MNKTVKVISHEVKKNCSANMAKYSGSNSKNFICRKETIRRMIKFYVEGYSIAPGLFDANKINQSTGLPAGSHRSKDSFVRTEFRCFDADEWEKAEIDPPSCYEELIEQYPNIVKYFFYVGESSKGHPNYRFMLRLPEIYEPEGFNGFRAYNLLGQQIVSEMPFIAQGSATDVTRLSFGNCMKDRRHYLYLNTFPKDKWKEYLILESDDEYRESTTKTKRKRGKKKTEENANNKPRMLDLSAHHPWRQFTEQVDAVAEIKAMGYLVEDMGNGEFVWKGSSDEVHSAKVDNISVKPFSDHAIADCLEQGQPINSHRFVALKRYGYDVVDKDQKDGLYRALVEDGYGRHGIYRDITKKIEIDSKLRKVEKQDFRREQFQKENQDNQEAQKTELMKHLVKVTEDGVRDNPDYINKMMEMGTYIEIDTIKKFLEEILDEKPNCNA